MLSLCSNIQQTHLNRLLELVRNQTVSGTQAWSAFSVPEAIKTFKLTNGKSKKFKFSLPERKTYAVLRQNVQVRLFQKYGRSCAYCRRPVGHYGYDWHIEHVLAKAKYPADTFNLANLTVGCVHCNRWKGVSVDPHVKRKKLPIINPVEPGFQYSQHLKYLQISTEALSFVKYSPLSTPGTKTYRLLRLDELERAHAVNSLNGLSAALHERLTRAMSVGLTQPGDLHFIKLISELASAIYRNP